jgi:hexosaminidase
MPAAWDVFVNTLGQGTLPLLPFYQLVGLPGVGCQLSHPLPGGRIEGGILNANVRNPGLAIKYSVDKGMNWQSDQGPVNVGAAWLRTRAPDERTSRISYNGQP